MFARHAGLILALTCFLLIMGICASLPIWLDLDLDPPDPSATVISCPPRKVRTLWRVLSQMPLLVRQANTAKDFLSLIDLYRPVLETGMRLTGFASLVSVGAYFLGRRYCQGQEVGPVDAKSDSATLQSDAIMSAGGEASGRKVRAN
jgi:hypothetical protein